MTQRPIRRARPASRRLFIVSCSAADMREALGQLT